MSELFRQRYEGFIKERQRMQALGNAEVIAAGKERMTIPGDLTTLPSFSGTDLNTEAATLPNPRPGMLARTMEVLSFGIEGLNRATQATREVALFANQKTSLESFKKRFTGALNGDVKHMPRHEFFQLMVGSETYNAMQQTPFIPGWFAAISEPEQAMIGGKRRPKVSVADVLSLGMDALVDPFTVLALTPVGAGVKFSNVAMKGLRPIFRPATKALSTLFGPRSNSPLAFINFLRQPEDVLPKDIFSDLAAATFRTNSRAHEQMLAVQSAMKGIKWRGKDDQQLAAWLHGLKVGKDGILEPGVAKLSGAAETAARALKPILTKNLDDLLKSGAITKADLNRPLADFYPKLVGKHSIPTDIWQSWSAEHLGKINLAIKREGYQQGHITLDNLSGIDSVKDFIYGVSRKAELEPALLKYAPKVAGRGEDHPLTASMSMFQRRYLTDLINNFTGNARGRKQIEFDILLEDFSDRVMQSPFGQRILNLQRKLGGSKNVGGNTLPDISTTNKLAGMMTHQIIRATLGGNLSSAIQNMTQVSNFAVSRGIPATIKGMLGFGSKQNKLFRKSVNLQQDFHALWDDDLWVSKLGKKYDDVIMGPFNIAENLIRGTGFHIGLNQYLKKYGLKDVGEALAKGHRDKMLHSAHLESINGAFIYGVLGRAPIFGNPLLKPATTLLSYPYKQAEFLRRTFTEDGGALLRFIGLHGFLIEKANNELNIAAEDFLGLGFRPMTRSFGGIPLVASPQVGVLLDSAEMLTAFAKGDQRLAEQKMKSLIDTENLDAFGLPGGNLPIALGVNPLPWLGIRDLARLKEHLVTSRQRIGKEGGWENITTGEAISNFLVGRSTTQKMRSDLRARQEKAKRKVAFEMDKRASKFVKALNGDSGDDLGEASWEAAQGIEIEGKLFYPTPEQFNDRVKTLMEKRVIRDDLRTLSEGDFIQYLFINAQLELFQRSSSGQ